MSYPPPMPDPLVPDARLRDLLDQSAHGDLRHSDQLAVIKDLMALRAWLALPTFRVRYSNYEPAEYADEVFASVEDAEAWIESTGNDMWEVVR